MSAARFPMGIYWVLLALIAIVGVGPMLAAFVAESVGNANGCSLPEDLLYDRSNPCLIGGIDRGDDLQRIALLGGLYTLLIGVPMAVLLFVIWLVALFFHRSRFAQRAAA